MDEEGWDNTEVETWGQKKLVLRKSKVIEMCC